MKRTVRFPAIFVCFLLMAAFVFPVRAFAAGSAIDTSTSSDGYFTVAYLSEEKAKMKVGVTQGTDTVYYDYVPGDASAYTFTDGDGAYTITLYQNISGIKYKKVECVDVNVAMTDPMAPYLVSTEEITFSGDDAVSRKAAELCAGLTADEDKAVAIHNYIAANFTYDSVFGDQVKTGEVKNYTPDTNAVLAARKGICYDFSALYAAMCRSQGIPCAIARGYLNGGYHAWNMVYIDGTWNAVDMTREIANANTDAATIGDCVIALEHYIDMRY